MAPPAPMGGAPDRADGSARRTAGYVVLGVGGAAAAVGAVFGVLAISKEGDADDLCGDGAEVCPTQEGLDASEAAHDYASAANGLVFGGLGAAVVGLVVALTAPTDEEPEPAARLTPWVGPTGGGATLGLRW